MRRTLTLFSAFLISSILFSQAPEGFKYQAVVRGNDGNLITEQAVGFQIDILMGSIEGASVYSETHSETTNTLGLVNLEIGNGTTTDDFSAIKWGDDKYFIQVSLDATGGTSYELMGTSQLLSVPYALHAGTADTVMMESQTLSISGDTLSIRDGNSVVLPSEGTVTGQGNLIFILSGNITDAEASQMIADEVGSNTRYIRIENTSQLTTIDLSGVKDLIELTVQSNESLSNLIIGDLETGRDLVFHNCPSLTTLNLESLSTCVYLQVICKELSNLNISNLTFISDLNFSSCHALTTLDISKLVASRDFQIIKSGLESIQISNLSEIGSFVMNYNKLTSESVNYLLAHFASISPIIIGKDIHLSGQTPPAPPTGQGIIDKATLEANGNTIYTD